MKLVVTADDLGLSPAVTRGVLASHRRGIVRSASLLVTFPDGEAAAAAARELPGLEVGLHLDLVEGTPAADPARVRTLVDDDGRFLALGRFVRALFTGRIRASEVATEVRAQAARARSWGLDATAWDSHRHMHALPLVARVVGAVAREEGVRYLRRPAPPAVWHGPKAWALRAACRAASPFLRGIPGNDWYVDLSSWRGDAAAVALLAAYGGVGEIGAHPGEATDGDGGDPLARRRPEELALLTDPLLLSALADEAVSWRTS